MIILDTNVVSELMRSEPALSVASWVRDRDRRELRTTAVTLAGVRYGIARLPDGRRKQILLAAADEIFSAFAYQVLPVDTAAAEHYAVIASSRERAGKPIAGFDALIDRMVDQARYPSGQDYPGEGCGNGRLSPVSDQ